MSDEEKKVEETTEAPAPAAAEEAPAAEEAKEEAKEVEVPKEFKDIVEKIEKMTVLELNTLVKVFEEKFGVSATAAAAAPAAGADAGDAGSSEVNVELTAAGDQKIQVIKAVKNALGLGLKEAKDLVDGVPVMLKEKMKPEEAEELKAQITEAGGSVEFK
tara:strand:+ start:1368 stop:1847 length:480 start_codon:yes stop_codon:yes gene_type:complete